MVVLITYENQFSTDPKSTRQDSRSSLGNRQYQLSIRGSKEFPLLHEILFEKSISTFIIRISGETTEEDVINCFQNYYKVVEENFDNRDFSIIINVDEEAHSSIAVLRLIRSCLENQEHRDYIAIVVAVNENPIRVTARTSTSDNLLPFFIKETEARQYIPAKLQHKTDP